MKTKNIVTAIICAVILAGSWLHASRTEAKYYVKTYLSTTEEVDLEVQRERIQEKIGGPSCYTLDGEYDYGIYAVDSLIPGGRRGENYFSLSTLGQIQKEIEAMDYLLRDKQVGSFVNMNPWENDATRHGNLLHAKMSDFNFKGHRFLRVEYPLEQGSEANVKIVYVGKD